MTDEAIEAYLRGVREPTRGTLAELCRVLASLDPRTRSEIKWNAPSFAIDDHFATTGVERSGEVRLVLHTGATRVGEPREIVVDDPDGILDWKGVDRAVAVFGSVEDVRSHEPSLRSITTAWIAQTQSRSASD